MANSLTQSTLSLGDDSSPGLLHTRNDMSHAKYCWTINPPLIPHQRSLVLGCHNSAVFVRNTSHTTCPPGRQQHHCVAFEAYLNPQHVRQSTHFQNAPGADQHYNERRSSPQRPVRTASGASLSPCRSHAVVCRVQKWLQLPAPKPVPRVRRTLL